MKRRMRNRQADLFDPEDPSSRVRDLDQLIAAALRRKEYDLAKKLTAEQESLIQQQVERAEGKQDQNHE